MGRKESYSYLNRKPRIKGVNSIYNIGILERCSGKKDARQNQVRQTEEGHTTPYIEQKNYLYDSYIDKIYLKTSLRSGEIIREAAALIVELNLILAEDGKKIEGNGEEAQRQEAFWAAARVKNERRKEEILIRIAEIRAENDIVDENLKHHIERAEGILHSHISRYWRGILAAAEEDLEYFPCMKQKNYEGRTIYWENREKIIFMIEEAIRNGGGLYEVVEKQEKEYVG